MTYRRKLIEVSLPLEAINAESAREKSIRHGHPSTLHLWWARRPLAACRAVLFSSLVDDPSEYMPDEPSADAERERLFGLIEQLVKWENINDETVLDAARLEIARSVARDLGVEPPIGKAAIRKFLEEKAPPVLDPFAGGGSIPLEAQRLGLRAYASDLNPVAVLINKALIEIPPKFAGMPPVHPPHPPAPSPMKGEGGEEEGEKVKLHISEDLRRKMTAVAREFRKAPTASEAILWQALRGRKLDGVKFRRQQPIGPFVVDFYASLHRLVVEVDGPVHGTQVEADRQRQQLLETLGLKVLRLAAQQVETDLPAALQAIRAAIVAHPSPNPFPLHGGRGEEAPPSPLVGEGGRGVEGAQLPLWKKEWQGAQGLAEDVRYYGAWMRAEAEKRIGHLYPQYTLTAELLAERPDLKAQGLKPGDALTVIAWLWARTVKCPNPACGARTPLVRSFWLSKRKDRAAYANPVYNRQNLSLHFEVKTSGSPILETTNRNGARCLFCDTLISKPALRAQASIHGISEIPLAIVCDAIGGRVYLPYSSLPLGRVEKPIVVELDCEITDDHRWFSPPLYGLTKFQDLFTSRQLISLTTFSEIISEIRDEVYKTIFEKFNDSNLADAYSSAVSMYLAFCVDKAANLWSTITSWMNDRGAFRETFARQALPMVWDYAEANPFSEAGGNIEMFVERISDVIDLLPASISGVCEQANIQDKVITDQVMVSTDPPYYDNIGYADLSDFFYIWLRKALRKNYPELLSTVLVPKLAELTAVPHRFNGNRAEARDYFENGLRAAFGRLRKAQVAKYPLTVYYAFKQSENEEEDEAVEQDSQASTGWETMLEGMISANFSIAGTWPVRTEGAGRIVAIGTNALASSIVLVCRPRPEDAPTATRREFLAALKRELAPALRQLQQGNIAPVDLAQAAIGPGMAIFSRYKAVLEAGGQPMRVRAALALINQALDEYLSEQEGEYDADTRWALAWFEQYGHEAGPYGVAETLSKAKNTSVEGLAHAGFLESRAGKVRLLRRDELALTPGPSPASGRGGKEKRGEKEWDPAKDDRLTAWESAQHLIRSLDRDGESGAGALLNRLGALSETIRDLAYRLYTVCERKGWAQEALSYNMLVVAWPRIKEQGGKRQEQGRLL